MQLSGKVHEIGQTVVVSDKFKKRELIIEYADNPSYPEFIKFEATQDKISLFDSLSVGQNVEVLFNLRGKPYTDKNGKTTYFNSLVVWKVNAGQSNPSAGITPSVDFNTLQPEEDDLPFS